MCLMLSRYDLPAELDAERVFQYLVTLNQPVFWLDSGDDATTGLSYLGSGAEVHTAKAGEEREFLAKLRRILSEQTSFRDAQHQPSEMQSTPQNSHEPSFQLGLVGWFSYEFGLNLLGLRATYTQSEAPAMFVNTNWALEINHEQQRIAVIAENETVLSKWLDTHLGALTEFTASEVTAPIEPAQTRSQQPAWRDTEQTYLDKIAACQRAIADGDAYLLCLTSQARVPVEEHPAQLYVRLRRLNPTHHGGFISANGISLLSASPERFLAVDAQGWAHTKPIKGTRPRGATPDDDAALAAELKIDSKERAENLMIVDLMRNDFARVCEPGTVHVAKLHDVETYTHVHQLVSTILGRLTQKDDAFSAFEACFPAGSMTGTPKRRAIELLADLERHPRGLYSGCFGYFSRDGSADLAMVIRSIVVAAGEATVGAGGGITANSNPVDEFAEVHLKADALIAALERPARPVM